MIDVHGILVKLVQVADAALPVQVLDGRDYSVEVDPEALVIGMAANPGVSVVTVSRSLDAGSLDDTLYDLAIACRMVVWDGEEEFAAKRAKVQAHMATLNAAIEADVQLGGTVYEAWVAPEQQWFQVADTEGNSVEVDFTVTVSVFG